MKGAIRDKDALRALRPLDAVSYLRAFGWRESGSAPDPERVSTWVARDQHNEEFEASVPLDQEFRDYAQRMADLLQVIEAFERRSQFEIFRDIMQSSADVIRIRLVDPELSDGSVPLDEGAEFFHRARDLMLSAACAAVRPKSYYPSRKPDQALDYLRKVRLGQTEQGSFVMTIISRVAPSLAAPEDGLFETEDPFERKVTQRLASSLSAVKTAVREAATRATFEGFARVVSHGVSANLCDALVGMAQDVEGDRNLEFNFTWSANRPLHAMPHVDSRVVLTSDAFPVIKQAAKYFKETSPQEDFELLGPVVKLEQSSPDEPGKVTIAGFVDGTPKKIAFTLPPQEYATAVEAHRDGQLVSCRGLLTREGKLYKLDDVLDFGQAYEED